jgi:hypothetical protein
MRRRALVVLEVGVERLLGDLVDEPGPARVAVLACEHGLCAREARRQVAEPRDGSRFARARGTRELLGLLAKVFEIHHDLLPRAPGPRRRAGRRSDVCCRLLPTRWAQPCPRTGCALAARSASSRRVLARA